MFRNIVFFKARSYQHLAHPPLAGGPPSSVFRDFFFNMFAVTPHIGDRSNILNAPYRGDRDPLITVSRKELYLAIYDDDDDDDTFCRGHMTAFLQTLELADLLSFCDYFYIDLCSGRLICRG
jgi:hypothetical protein